MIHSIRRHPRLTLAIAGIIVFLAILAEYLITPTYLGALFHHRWVLIGQALAGKPGQGFVRSPEVVGH
jgi:hypothetical protein